MKNIITKTELSAVVDELISQILIKMGTEHNSLQRQITQLFNELEEIKGASLDVNMPLVVETLAVPNNSQTVDQTQLTAYMATIAADRELEIEDLTDFDLEEIERELNI